MSDRPFRVAVVGSGPAGFYAAGALLASDEPLRRGGPDRPAADALGARPARGGARPSQHQGRLARLREDRAHSRASASSATSRSVATSPTKSSQRRYDAVVYAIGAQTDRRLGIPGEDLPGSWPATAFVAWYNGHPDFQELEFDLSHERAVVIGNGNVALDVARMLALTPEELAPTDTTDAAIDAINGAGVKEILVLGRRGPVQAAWTPVEVGELGDLAGADIVVDPADLELDEASAAELAAAPPTVKRNLEHLRAYAAREPEGKARAIRLRFLASPTAILGDEKVEAIELVRNELVEGRAVPTDVRETVECGIVFRSVGYRGLPLPGVPFDEGSCTVPNDRGRVLGSDGAPLAGVYCAGWIKRGPTGVIGTNKKDATETAELLLEDARAGRLRRGPDAPAIDDASRGARHRRRDAVRVGGDRRRRARGRRAARAAPGEAREWERAPRRGGRVRRPR